MGLGLGGGCGVIQDAPQVGLVSQLMLCLAEVAALCCIFQAKKQIGHGSLLVLEAREAPDRDICGQSFRERGCWEGTCVFCIKGELAVYFLCLAPAECHSCLVCAGPE